METVFGSKETTWKAETRVLVKLVQMWAIDCREDNLQRYLGEELSKVGWSKLLRGAEGDRG